MKKVKEYLSKSLKENQTVVVACSGGPDSMCLLNLLIEEKTRKKITVICAHVNHKMRIESEEEASFVKEYCEKNDCIFEYMEITDYNDDNFHNQARIKRYNFFKELLKKYNANYLMTAHHGDDLMETVLMRITRGSNLKGYIGFKKESRFYENKMLRPLITVSKSEIEKYTKENNIPYRIDKSNEKDKYTRNRYRHKVLPFFKSEDSEVHKKFLKFSNELIEIEEFLTNHMSNLLTDLIKNDTLDISLFHSQDKFIQKKVIESMISKIQEDDLFFIEDKHIEIIMDLLYSKKSNSYVILPNGYIGEKSYNEFRIIKDTKNESYNLEFNEKISLNNGIQLIKENKSNDTSNNTIRLNSKELAMPLYVRNKKDGDKIAVKNLSGTKKVKDIFIDSKIVMSKRQSWPILVDSNNTVIWVPGLKKSNFDKKIDDNYDIIIRYKEENDE